MIKYTDVKEHPTKEWVYKEIKQEMKNTWKPVKIKSTTLQPLWDATKAVLGGKYSVFQFYLMKQENFPASSGSSCIAIYFPLTTAILLHG